MESIVVDDLQQPSTSNAVPVFTDSKAEHDYYFEKFYGTAEERHQNFMANNVDLQCGAPIVPAAELSAAQLRALIEEEEKALEEDFIRSKLEADAALERQQAEDAARLYKEILRSRGQHQQQQDMVGEEESRVTGDEAINSSKDSPLATAATAASAFQRYHPVEAAVETNGSGNGKRVSAAKALASAVEHAFFNQDRFRFAITKREEDYAVEEKEAAEGRLVWRGEEKTASVSAGTAGEEKQKKPLLPASMLLQQLKEEMAQLSSEQAATDDNSKSDTIASDNTSNTHRLSVSSSALSASAVSRGTKLHFHHAALKKPNVHPTYPSTSEDLRSVRRRMTRREKGMNGGEMAATAAAVDAAADVEGGGEGDDGNGDDAEEEDDAYLYNRNYRARPPVFAEPETLVDAPTAVEHGAAIKLCIAHEHHVIGKRLYMPPPQPQPTAVNNNSNTSTPTSSPTKKAGSSSPSKKSTADKNAHRHHQHHNSGESNRKKNNIIRNMTTVPSAILKKYGIGRRQTVMDVPIIGIADVGLNRRKNSESAGEASLVDSDDDDWGGAGGSRRASALLADPTVCQLSPEEQRAVFTFQQEEEEEEGADNSRRQQQQQQEQRLLQQRRDEDDGADARGETSRRQKNPKTVAAGGVTKASSTTTEIELLEGLARHVLPQSMMGSSTTTASPAAAATKDSVDSTRGGNNNDAVVVVGGDVEEDFIAKVDRQWQRRTEGLQHQHTAVRSDRRAAEVDVEEALFQQSSDDSDGYDEDVQKEWRDVTGAIYGTCRALEYRPLRDEDGRIVGTAAMNTNMANYTFSNGFTLLPTATPASSASSSVAALPLPPPFPLRRQQQIAMAAAVSEDGFERFVRMLKEMADLAVSVTEKRILDAAQEERMAWGARVEALKSAMLEACGGWLAEGEDADHHEDGADDNKSLAPAKPEKSFSIPLRPLEVIEGELYALNQQFLDAEQQRQLRQKERQQRIDRDPNASEMHYSNFFNKQKAAEKATNAHAFPYSSSSSSSYSSSLTPSVIDVFTPSEEHMCWDAIRFMFRDCDPLHHKQWLTSATRLITHLDFQDRPPIACVVYVLDATIALQFKLDQRRVQREKEREQLRRRENIGLTADAGAKKKDTNNKSNAKMKRTNSKKTVGAAGHEGREGDDDDDESSSYYAKLNVRPETLKLLSRAAAAANASPSTASGGGDDDMVALAAAAGSSRSAIKQLKSANEKGRGGGGEGSTRQPPTVVIEGLNETLVDDNHDGAMGTDVISSDDDQQQHHANQQKKNTKPPPSPRQFLLSLIRELTAAHRHPPLDVQCPPFPTYNLLRPHHMARVERWLSRSSFIVRKRIAVLQALGVSEPTWAQLHVSAGGADRPTKAPTLTLGDAAIANVEYMSMLSS